MCTTIWAGTTIWAVGKGACSSFRRSYLINNLYIQARTQDFEKRVPHTENHTHFNDHTPFNEYQLIK